MLLFHSTNPLPLEISTCLAMTYLKQNTIQTEPLHIYQELQLQPRKYHRNGTHRYEKINKLSIITT